MEGLIVLVVLLVVGAPLATGIWLIARAVGDRKSIEELKRRFGDLEAEVLRPAKRREPAPLRASAPLETTGTASTAAARTSVERPGPIPAKAAEAPLKPGSEEALGITSPPPVPARPVPARITPAPAGAGTPPPIAADKTEPGPVKKPGPAINWEQFMGVKLFAWIGGWRCSSAWHFS